MIIWDTPLFVAALVKTETFSAPDGFWQRTLAPQERETLAQISHLAYREESAAAKTLAKFLVLWKEMAAREMPGDACMKKTVVSQAEAASFFAKYREKWSGWSVSSRDGQGRGVKPVIRGSEGILPLQFSVAHGGRYAAVAVKKLPLTGAEAEAVIQKSSLDGVAGIGCDLVKNGEPTGGVQQLFFTEAERTLAQKKGVGWAEKIWAAKEAAYKAAANPDFSGFVPRDYEVCAETLDASGDENPKWIRTTGKPMRLFFLQETPMIFVVAAAE